MIVVLLEARCYGAPHRPPKVVNPATSATVTCPTAISSSAPAEVGMIVAMEHHQRCHAMDAGTGMARSRVGKRKGFEGLSLRSRLRPRHDARVPQIETVTGPQPQPRALRVATTEAERGEADALRQMMAAEERAQAAAMEPIECHQNPGVSQALVVGYARQTPRKKALRTAELQAQPTGRSVNGQNDLTGSTLAMHQHVLEPTLTRLQCDSSEGLTNNGP